MSKCTGLLAVIILFATVSLVNGEVIPPDSDRWQFSGDGVKQVDYKGQQALYLPAGEMAVIKDADFGNGIIEYDVALPDARGFMGVMWRIQDEQNFEEFYMRPHQSGNPDASQYTPVYNNVSGWQLYYGDSYSVRYRYPFGEWLHVKMLVSGTFSEIYLNNAKEPSLTFTLKRGTKSGKVGIRSVGSPVFKLTGAHFAYFSFTPQESVRLQGKAVADSAPVGTIMHWHVSSTFGGNVLDGKMKLEPSDYNSLQWDSLDSEATGVTNFALLRQKTRKQNTVFAKIVVSSDTAQIKQMDFGFSDRVKVYLNNSLLFSANDTYSSRDYRFLGTMGYYDSLYLPLEKGENVVYLAVSERFGGWGVQAKFQDMTGIKINNR